MSDVNSLAARINMLDHLKKVLKGSSHLSLSDHAYSRAKKALFRLSEKNLEGILERYASRPDILNAKLEEFTHRLFDQLEIFQSEFNKLVELSDNIIIELEREEFEELETIERVLEQWMSSDKKAVFTKGVLKKCADAFVEFEQELAGFIRQDVRNDKREMKKKSPKVGFLTRLKSIHRLSKEVRKLAKKELKRKGGIEKIEAELHAQLERGIGPNFPLLFIELLRAEGISEAIMHKLRDDVREFAFLIYKEFYDVATHLMLLTRYLMNIPAFQSRIEKMEHELSQEEKKLGTVTIEFLNKDIHNQSSLYKELGKEDNIFRWLIKRLQEDERKTREAMISEYEHETGQKYSAP